MVSEEPSKVHQGILWVTGERGQVNRPASVVLWLGLIRDVPLNDRGYIRDDDGYIRVSGDVVLRCGGHPDLIF